MKEYWNPIRDIVHKIHNIHAKPSIVLFVHGMSDDRADKAQNGLAIAVGKGYIGQHDDAAASASSKFLENLVEKLKKKKLGLVRDDIERYSGATKLPPALRKKYPDKAVDFHIMLTDIC